MGCAGSTEGEQGQESAIKVKDNTAAADKPEIESADPGPQLPTPKGEQFHVLVGDKIKISTYLDSDGDGAQSPCSVQVVINFLNWTLAQNKSMIPEGYDVAELAITGLSSPYVLSDGLIFCPDDQISELDGWDEGERFLVALTKEWKINKYLNSEEEHHVHFIPKPPADGAEPPEEGAVPILAVKGQEYWDALGEVALQVEYNTDLRAEDIPEEYDQASKADE